MILTGMQLIMIEQELNKFAYNLCGKKLSCKLQVLLKQEALLF